MRQMQKKIKMGIDLYSEEDMFETFVAQTNIRYSYYNETHKILGNTYGMLVLQHFEAITPNLLARTIETIEGGGLIAILLNSVNSLKQLYTMAMDVHSRYRTEAHQEVIARFNERFILSIASCKKCVVVDDKLNILPISSHVADITPVPKTDSSTPSSPEDLELSQLRESLADTQPVGSIINLCKTLDQAKAVLKFIDIISEKTLTSTVSLTASRGRGKSAALGLAISAAIAFNYSNIYVTSPSPENLKTLFDFVLKGFDAIHLKEHLDYDIIQSTNVEFNKAVVRINIFREHRQTIQYIHPTDALKNKILGQSAELVVIDEAAAIPLTIVKSLIGPYLVFMSSTINGYEGTGRSLSLKLLQQLRQQSSTFGPKSGTALTGRNLHELTLNESIRYQNGDDVEQWLNKLLCLDASIAESVPTSGCPLPQDCELYYINRDTLFSYHKASESFLQRIMALYVSSHYKNSPNDLQMMSDAPAHHLFCLLPPISQKHRSKGKLPDVLCFIQVCLEGEISQDSIMNSLSRGKRASGDLIPWTISQQYQDSHFGSLSGVRIVRIATNPNYQGMGYGSRALQLLEDYYSGHFNVDINETNDTEVIESCVENCDDSEGLSPRKSLSPLLLALNERKAERLDYLGVSFGLTSELLKFWKKSGFVPIYLRQTPNDLTGEHSCIMLKVIDDHSNKDPNVVSQRSNNWLSEFWVDFRRRFIALLSYQFNKFVSAFALNILHNTSVKIDSNQFKELTQQELEMHLTLYDLKRLELYSQNLVDYHLIVDLLPTISKLYFSQKFSPQIHLSHIQNAILLSIGLQHKDVDDICLELGMQSSQVLGLFSRSIKKFATYLRGIKEKAIEETLSNVKSIGENRMRPINQSLDDELEEAAKVIKKAENKEFKQLSKDLSQYAIKGSEDDWDNALKGSQKTLISIKR
jgi:N-acetyltransferase 10